MSGAPNSSSGPRRTAALRQSRPLQHHRAGVGAGHVQVRGVGAGVDPGALAQGPAVARRIIGLPALHLDDPVIDVQPALLDEPMAKFAEREAVAHRQRTRADEALPARAQGQALHRPAGGVRPVEHPDRLAVLGGRFEHVQKRGDEGVDAAAQILQVDQQDVERPHHLAGRSAVLAVEAEHRHAMDRIGEIRALDHIVLLVAAHAVLGSDGGGELQIRQGGERVQRMGQVVGHRSGMGQEGDAAAGQRGAQGGVGDEAVEAELHGRCIAASSRAKQSAWWKSGLPGGNASAQYETAPPVSSMTAESPSRVA
jgi:hypothetical protein